MHYPHAHHPPRQTTTTTSSTSGNRSRDMSRNNNNNKSMRQDKASSAQHPPQPPSTHAEDDPVAMAGLQQHMHNFLSLGGGEDRGLDALLRRAEEATANAREEPTSAAAPPPPNYYRNNNNNNNSSTLRRRHTTHNQYNQRNNNNNNNSDSHRHDVEEMIIRARLEHEAQQAYETVQFAQEGGNHLPLRRRGTQDQPDNNDDDDDEEYIRAEEDARVALRHFLKEQTIRADYNSTLSRVVKLIEEKRQREYEQEELEAVRSGRPRPSSTSFYTMGSTTQTSVHNDTDEKPPAKSSNNDPVPAEPPSLPPQGN